MPLSEHEQRLLEQIERALYADDPKLASSVRAINPRTYAIRRLWRSLLLFIVGLAVLVAGVAISSSAVSVVLGMLGFVLMLVAALRGNGDLRRLGGRPEVDRRAPRKHTAASGPAASTPRPARPAGSRRRDASRPRSGFMERLEQRWRRRWEGRDGGF